MKYLATLFKKYQKVGIQIGAWGLSNFQMKLIRYNERVISLTIFEPTMINNHLPLSISIFCAFIRFIRTNITSGAIFKYRKPEVRQNPADIHLLQIIIFKLLLLKNSITISMVDYQPFLYPPDFQATKYHQLCTMPGKITNHSIVGKQSQTMNKSENSSYPKLCPCCSEPPKQLLSSWNKRSITQDFKYYGGAVVTYFWLIKLYGIITALVLMIYSGFLFVCTIRYCTPDVCEKFMYFVWVVSNERLYEIMQKAYQQQSDPNIYILFTLRSVAYLILIGGNTAAVFLVSRYKKRYPHSHGIQKFSVIFKNLPDGMQSEDLYIKLKAQFPQIKIVQIFQLRKLEPYYTLYQNKLTKYYESLIEQNSKKRHKLLKQLQKLVRKCERIQAQYGDKADRAILVVQSESARKQIISKYKQNTLALSLKYLFGFQNKSNLYVEACPIPEQIIWNNIGQHQQQKIKYKILSVIYFLVLVGLSYLTLFFCMEIIYRKLLQQPWNFIATNLILFFMVYIALTFRQFMNKLSQMRYPNTQTSRTLFIVLTTVVFHLIFYLLIPTFYLAFAQKTDKNQVMVLITNQIFNFMLVQFILAGLDFMHYNWQKRQKSILVQQKPIGCQKIINKICEYPRFPIEFKLIILFKIFSFITLVAFQTPSLLFVIFIFLIFLYYYDKKAVYQHYRMEIIDNKVLYIFLKIYSNFYSVYTFVAFSITQHLQVQFWGGLAVMIVAIIVQLFFINQGYQNQSSLKQELGVIGIGIKAHNLKNNRKQDVSIISECSDDNHDSYKKRYDKFRQNITNDRIDAQIKEYLQKNGYTSLSQDSIAKQRLL